MLNKPAGYLTTMDDPQGRPTVRELVPHEAYPGLFPVGRLDCDTTGLLLFMTDGELAHTLLHPRHKVAKRYRALVDGVLDELEADRLREGVLLSDGATQPALVEIGTVERKRLSARERLRLEEDETFSPWQTTAWCTIFEGRKRQVRRMFAHIGYPVLALEREAFGPLTLGSLKPGQWRLLLDDEVATLCAEA
jgi:23S rRNA pseudouridine2605 synthase